MTKRLADFAEAIRRRTRKPQRLRYRAQIWATCRDRKHRDAKKAVEWATKACELTKWNNPDYLETLARRALRRATSTRQ